MEYTRTKTVRASHPADRFIGRGLNPSRCREGTAFLPRSPSFSGTPRPAIGPLSSLPYSLRSLRTGAFAGFCNIGLASHDVLLARESSAQFQSVATGLGGTTRSFSLTSAIVGNAKSTTARIHLMAKDTVGNTGTGDSAPFRINSK